MGKGPPIDEHLKAQAIAAVAAAWDEGNPVASPPHEASAEVCLRRWRSMSRRGIKPADRQQQIRDMAKGLAAHFERDPKLIGPLIVDYEHVAGKVLDAIETIRT